MADEKPYHHGDLRAALLAAAEAELSVSGIEAFSLRAVAKRAGVSHAAPAHHFGDANGVLTALATEGYVRLVAAQGRRQAQSALDPRAQLVASGLGYIDFAIECPALFRLIFGSARPDHNAPGLNTAARTAYVNLADLVGRAGGQSDGDLAIVWALAHGLADLLIAGRLSAIGGLPPAARDAMLRDILARSLPAD